MQDLDELTEALYACISFGKGGQPDLEKLKTFFYKGGRLINNVAAQPQEFTVDQFVDVVAEQVKNGKLEAFSEREVSSKTEVFGKVAHRFSTYEARFDPSSAAPFSVGVNSIQFIKVNGHWLISSMVWDDETA
ncbi:hypothetical protein [Pontibacter actiniarum]|uniref:DUF4440 domain-containing protein n=1 Tax=Pontibacter actiniarum TaxID=323450 RepID=A0A1X9YVG1_9BACT|nr:hypothetical protein [Pontibacter actiniarum]ARS36910.1 hypothetical protein CA264_16575 [Pontibacter actiniarum]